MTRFMKGRYSSIYLLMLTSLIYSPAALAECGQDVPGQRYCPKLEYITIIGTRLTPEQVTGAAQVIGSEELQQFNQTDIVRALRRVPGVSLQSEDGYGLRPNISIRGTATERSSRITLLEDNVLIAPAPYAAPSAYYFPTTGRINSVEILKGPAAIMQGPYTIGGAINLVSTQIPDGARGATLLETGSDSTWRFHGSYGDSSERGGWLLETHQWQSDGYQDIDRSGSNTGLDKEDYLFKARINSSAGATYYQQLDLKLQRSDELSEQSYLGLTDTDFNADPFRRYGLSELDAMANEHEQMQLDYLVEISDNLSLSATLYDNRFERNWFKTEGIDFDGSANAQEFDRTSWNAVVSAINTGADLNGMSPAMLQAVLDGADTLPGSIQLRNNNREYFSRGIQFGMVLNFDTGDVSHNLKAGIRYHEDEEDRLQLNSTYHQENGSLQLDDLGLTGNAGNRIQAAEAWAFYVYDRIELGRLTLAPGVRYESISQSRTRWETRSGKTTDPASRDSANLRDSRGNEADVWIPGVGLLYELTDDLTLVAGVHKGFTAPTNAPGVDEETSINYELGLRYAGTRLNVDAIAFFNDYDNLLGRCTSSSGSSCEAGDAFNGDAVTIPGLELMLTYDFAANTDYALPFSLSYTWMNAEFDTNIADTEFFGDVSAGDPVPYIPEQQFLAQLGFERGRWATYVSANYLDGVCTMGKCGEFERTDSSLTFDLASHVEISDNFELYGMVENLTEENAILGRHPYGARPNKDRSATLGFKFQF